MADEQAPPALNLADFLKVPEPLQLPALDASDLLWSKNIHLTMTCAALQKRELLRNLAGVQELEKQAQADLQKFIGALRTKYGVTDEQLQAMLSQMSAAQ